MLTLYIYCNKLITWDEKKNALLRERRGVSFEDVAGILVRSGPVWAREHQRPDKYPGQRQLGVVIAGYVFIVPYEETDETIHFKTVYPSRRATGEYFGIGAKNKRKGPP